MVHEVVVVGGGIGGLTVAALLAARGVDVCLLERGSQLGGVVASVESFGYTFDPGVGIYPGWEAGGIHDRVFAQLPVPPPQVQRDTPAYVVRLPDGLDVPVSGTDDEFFAVLQSAFPDSAKSAVAFYRQCSKAVAAVESGNPPTTQVLSTYLADASPGFRQFIDAQLQLLTQSSSGTCNLARGALALTIPRRGNFAIQGGAAALAEQLAEAIRESGGRIRLNTPVLRLAFDSTGRAQGVDLLTGETVAASRAIISNLTIWDTFGKLIGLNRTPLEIRKALTSVKGWGTYLIYLGIDESVTANLPATRILALHEKQNVFDPESQLMFAATPKWDPRAPSGKRAVTVLTFTDVEDWFTFHESVDELQNADQAKLEVVWQRLHQTLPELGDHSEVIETATPLDSYEGTRRKLGMVGWPGLPPRLLPTDGSTYLENVFVVGDTVASGLGIAGVTEASLALANKLAEK